MAGWRNQNASRGGMATCNSLPAGPRSPDNALQNSDLSVLMLGFPRGSSEPTSASVSLSPQFVLGPGTNPVKYDTPNCTPLLCPDVYQKDRKTVRGQRPARTPLDMMKESLAVYIG